ncbi:MAG: phenylacetate--CoA ligase family protein, partial [Variovorax sp.]|nr:phenylacetate--CoA ligase family protein [Variovorax sp.]
MGLYTSLVSSWLFPLHERLKRHDSVVVRRELEASQWWGAERIEALQVERLRALLQDVAMHVPYYRELFARHAFDPAAVRGLADLRRLPFLTKSDIRAHTEALKHTHARDLVKFSTGGSTGAPLIFFIGNERISHDVAAKWRATRWWGVDIGDPEIVVWG